MKMVKSLLLGSAAGLVAVAGAQAADLPVKAKPVEYVKICTLYGEGYYYIPGSDTCLKFGGYVRGDYGWNVANVTPAYTGTQGAQDRTVSRFSTRTRANIQLDSRTQTEYGTLRSFASIHFDHVDGTNTETLARAFIQWAGFTFGHAQSFQDTWGITDSWHYVQQQNNSDTGANGVNQIAYTWEMGNGMTLTLGADAVRRKALTNLSANNAIKIGVEPTSSFKGQDWFDPYLAFKVNQAWGYWATSFVLHDVSATYYNGLVANAGTCGAGTPNIAATALSSCGSPSNKIGWAIQTGAEFRMDSLSPGDRLGFGLRYAVGASGYGGGSNLASAALFGGGDGTTAGSLAVGSMTDGVFINGGGIELTTTWTIMGGYEHQWTPTFKSSFAAGYTEVLYNGNAKALWASNVCNGNFQVGFTGGTLAANCNPDWGFFQGGVRTQWNPSRGFFLGIDVMYSHVYTAFKGATATVSGVNVSGTSGVTTLVNPIVGARRNGLYNIADDDMVSVVFRAQRNFNSGD